MAKITLSLVIHNHQPVGNFDFVFAEATERAYDPMLEALEHHPAVRLALHYTGPLLDWLTANRPDHLERLRGLVTRGQVELLTGAYYEPILVVIPDADKVGQIRKMTRFLRETFGCEATGVWLAERVWEPHLPKPLVEAGVRYALLDDTHFKMVGLTDDDLFGPYVTEEQGHSLTVFGNSMYLRYAIPWHPVEDVIGWLRQQANAHPGGVAVMGDDGEKFGLWPSTWEHCWGEGAWMERFFAALEANAGWLETCPPGKGAAERVSLGRVYLPCASYEEMMHWALPPDDFTRLARIRRELQEQHRDDVLRFVKGGLWRTFLARYDEVNQLHKKMLWVSRKVHRMAEGEEKARALDHVWAAQCNCGYWHGLFGGIYLFHIRVANYAHLIAAEALADGEKGRPSLPLRGKARPGAGWIRVERGDLDADGREEIILNSDRQVLVFKPSYGGALVEWDWRERRYNMLNAMARRREGYHAELVTAAEEGRLILPGQEGPHDGVRVKEPDIHSHLYHDWYRRVALLDHFLHPETTLDAFYRAQYGEQGNFVNQPYVATIEEGLEAATLTLQREGNIWVSDRQVEIRVKKQVTISAGSDSLDLHYCLTNMDNGLAVLRFGIEINWGIVGGDSEHCELRVATGRSQIANWESHRLSDFREHSDVSVLVVASRLPALAGEVTLNLNRPAHLWHFPLEAVSNSEAGYERVYQGTCTLLWWEIMLEPGTTWAVALRFALKSVPTGGDLD